MANNNCSKIATGFADAYAYSSVSAYYLMVLSVDLKFANMINILWFPATLIHYLNAKKSAF